MVKKKNGQAVDVEISSDGDANVVSAEALAEFIQDGADEVATHELAAETLTGDIRDFILDRLRYEQNKRPWHERSESEQRETVHSVETAVRDLAQRAIEIIAARGLRTIRAHLEQVTVKDGIKATVTLSRADQQRHALMDATGASIMIVVADAEEFTGERAPAAIKPDQGTLDSAMAVHSEPDGPGAAPFN